MADLTLVVGTVRRALTGLETGGGQPGARAPVWATSDATVVSLSGLQFPDAPYVPGTRQSKVWLNAVGIGTATITASDGAISNTFTIQVIPPDTITIHS